MKEKENYFNDYIKSFLVADKMLLRPADKIKLVHKGSSKKIIIMKFH
jgi:hypothetical protein